jgi:hypothetical protein
MWMKPGLGRWCHKKLLDEKGAHDHVRLCDANLTANRSYFAMNPRLIADGQRRYRIKVGVAQVETVFASTE